MANESKPYISVDLSLKECLLQGKTLGNIDISSQDIQDLLAGWAVAREVDAGSLKSEITQSGNYILSLANVEASYANQATGDNELTTLQKIEQQLQNNKSDHLIKFTDPAYENAKAQDGFEGLLDRLTQIASTHADKNLTLYLPALHKNMHWCLLGITLEKGKVTKLEDWDPLSGDQVSAPGFARLSAIVKEKNQQLVELEKQGQEIENELDNILSIEPFDEARCDELVGEQEAVNETIKQAEKIVEMFKDTLFVHTKAGVQQDGYTCADHVVREMLVRVYPGSDKDELREKAPQLAALRDLKLENVTSREEIGIQLRSLTVEAMKAVIERKQLAAMLNDLAKAVDQLKAKGKTGSDAALIDEAWDSVIKHLTDHKELQEHFDLDFATKIQNLDRKYKGKLPEDQLIPLARLEVLAERAKDLKLSDSVATLFAKPKMPAAKRADEHTEEVDEQPTKKAKR